MSYEYKLNTMLELGNEEYHAALAMSSTKLRDYAASPLLFHHRYNLRDMPFEDSPALRIGSIVDALVLEQSALDDMVAVIPAEVLNKDGHRKGGAWTEWAGQQGGKTLLKPEEWDDIRSMADSVWACPPAVELVTACKHQQATFWRDDDHDGIIGKCKFDGVCENGFFDLKTTSDALPDFRHSIKRYNYMLQLAWYAIGFEQTLGAWPEWMSWIVISKIKPYECMVLKPEGDYEKLARQHINGLLDKYIAQCESGDWHNEKYSEVVSYPVDVYSFGGY